MRSGKKSDESTFHANRGVERNKKPLKNIIYEVQITKLNKGGKELSEEDKLKYAKYKFKEEGYLCLYYYYGILNRNTIKNLHGFITPEELKKIIGQKQWGKFCQGKMTFIVQRRVDGKNVKKKKKDANS